MNERNERLDDLLDEPGNAAAMAAIADLDAVAPPPGLRNAVLSAAAGAPRRTVDPTPAPAIFRARIEALRELLADLNDLEWKHQASPYEWTVHGLIAHLLMIERYTAHALGIEPAGLELLVAEHDHLAMGADQIAAELQREPQQTAADWYAAAVRTADASLDIPGDLAAPLHGWPFDVTSALVARAFEVWTHTDDISRATGRQLQVPAAGELRTMSSFSVGALPFLLGTRMQPVRVVLTGDGGGCFDIGGDGPPVALLAADVVDYCRVVARRIAPAELAAAREGDQHLLDDLLVASSAFAV